MTLDIIGDDRGSLVALESNMNIPFEIKRIYYIFGTQPGIGRGYHAHIALQQVAVCVKGSCRMLLDDGSLKTEVFLDRPDKAVFIETMHWHEMHDFSEDCVLMVVASDLYDEADYIRDYDDFYAALN